MFHVWGGGFVAGSLFEIGNWPLVKERERGEGECGERKGDGGDGMQRGTRVYTPQTTKEETPKVASTAALNL